MNSQLFTIRIQKALLSAFVCGLGVWASNTAFADASKTHARALLSQRAPRLEQSSALSVKKLLGVAFQPEDLKALLNASGAASCFTAVEKHQLTDSAGRGTSRACVAAVEQAYYERVAFANDRFSQDLLPSYAPNALDASFIQRGAVSRMSTRLATQYIARNDLLKMLVEGKIDVDFSFRDFESVPSKFKVASHARPAYVLAVTYRSPGALDAPKLAAVGNDALVGLKPASHGLRDLPIAEKKIVEAWPQTEAEVVAPVVPVEQGFSVTKNLQRRLGLSAEPFSKFRLRLERAPGAFSLSSLALRLEDASGVANFDITGLMCGRADGVAYKFRLPYQRHSALVTADNLTMKSRYVYEYAATHKFRTRFAYDPNTANGVVPDARSGKYSVGMSYAF